MIAIMRSLSQVRFPLNAISSALQAVEIEINHACNRNCSYCPNSIAERITKGMMTTDSYQIILNNLVEINFEGRISFDFYNEPLLNPHLPEFVKMTKKQLPKTQIHLYSNGTLLTETKTLALLNSGVDRLVITKHEEDEFSETYVFDAVYNSLSELMKNKIDYKSYKELHLVNRGGLLKHIGQKGLALHPCFIPSHMLTVTVDLRVLSCFEDYHENLIFGDLKLEKLIDIWDKDSYKLFRGNLQKGLRHLHTPCRDCNRKEALPPFNN